MKIVINKCYGGFSLSPAGTKRFQELGGKLAEYDSASRRSGRNDPLLVQAVEELGEAADGSHAELKVVEIPDGVNWTIEEYDGWEWIAEAHRTWS